MTAEEIHTGKNKGYEQSEYSAAASVFFCQLFITLPEASSDKSHCGSLQSVSEGKRQSHDIHSDLMSRH